MKSELPLSHTFNEVNLRNQDKENRFPFSYFFPPKLSCTERKKISFTRVDMDNVWSSRVAFHSENEGEKRDTWQPQKVVQHAANKNPPKKTQTVHTRWNIVRLRQTDIAEHIIEPIYDNKTRKRTANLDGPNEQKDYSAYVVFLFVLRVCGNLTKMPDDPPGQSAKFL